MGVAGNELRKFSDSFDGQHFENGIENNYLKKKNKLNAFLIRTRCTTRTSYGNTVFEITADCRLRCWKGHLANEEIMNIGLKTSTRPTYLRFTFCHLPNQGSTNKKM